MKMAINVKTSSVSAGLSYRMAGAAMAFLALLAALVATLCLAPSTALAKSGTYVFDEYGLFTAEQFDTLESEAAQLADTYGMGVYFLTTDTMDGRMNPTSSQRTSFCVKYYKDHDLGLGSGKDGIMFAVAVDSRDYNTIAYGQGSYSFSDSGIAAMEDAVTGQLSGNNWYLAAQEYYDQLDGQLAYYARHGKAQEPLDAIDWIVRILIVLGLPLAIAGGFVFSGISAMRTARRKSEAGDYLQANSLVLTERSDRFLHTTHAAHKRASSKGSGGGGGGWGGGGGGGFSSSGGGKF